MSSSIVRVISSILLLPPALQPVHCPRAVAILLLLQTLQLLHFPLRQLTKFPWRNIQNQRSQPHPPDLLHIESHALKHPPDLPIAPLNQNHLVPGIGPIFHEANFRGRRLHPLPVLQLNRNSRPQTLDRLLLRFPADFHQIRLRHVRTRLHQLLRQRPVVRHQQQTFAGIVQPPHGIHTLRAFCHQLHHRQPSFRIADRGHVPLRLVQQKIKKPLRSFQRFSIHADLVPLRIGLRTQFRHHGSVERHPPRRNHLFRLAPRRNPARRHNFLQSFGSHSARILQRGVVVAGLQTGAFLSSLRSPCGRWPLRSIPLTFFFSSPPFSNFRNLSASFCSINRYLPRGIPSTDSGPSPMRFNFSTGCISLTSTRRISSFFESRIRTSYQKFAARPRDASGCRTVCIRTPISFPSRSRSGSVSIPFTLT